jgi:simple sugar transport system substrate-binding protein
MSKKILLAGAVLIIALFSMAQVFASQDKEGVAAPEMEIEEMLKIGFIYVGPIGDLGWTHAHDVARKKVEALPWAETIYQESVPEGDTVTVIERMIQQENADVVFTTSFGFMDGTVEAAAKFPDKVFAHCSGFKRAPNVANYMADFYQIYYLNGLMAGALTKSGKVGYVGAFPIPEVKRHINAFTIGVREVNPRAKVHVRWISAWFDPPAATEATMALIDEGCDVFAFTEDSTTVCEVAAQNGLPSFGHYSPMYDAAPNYVVSGQLVRWDVFYLHFLGLVYAGILNNKNLEDVDYWGLLKEGAVEVGAKFGMPVNPKWKPRLGKTYDLVMKRLEQMKDQQVVFDPFTGPIKDRKGNIVIPRGARGDYGHILTLEWAVEGVVGPWPNEP